MAKTGQDGEEFPLAGVIAARGRYQLKTWKGRPYAAKWPRSRGPSKTENQQAWVDHFSCVAQMSKMPHPLIFNTATQITKDTGWYYRDAIAAAAVGKLYQPNGAIRITTPTARLHGTASTSIPNTNTDTVVRQDVMDWDTNRFWDSANKNRLTFRAGGLYLIGATQRFNNISGGYRGARIRLNGTQIIANDQRTTGVASEVVCEPIALWYFSPNDYIELIGRTSTSGVTCTSDGFWVVAITPESVT